MAEFLSTLLALSLGASLMAALLYGLKLLMGRRLSSTVYYYLWLLVLLRFVLPMPGLMPTATENVAARPTEIRERSNTYEGPVRNYELPQTPSGVKYLEDFHDEDQDILNAPVTDGTAASSFSLPIIRPENVVFFIWVLGFAASLVYSISNYLRFSLALRREAISPESCEYECYRKLPPRKKPRLIKSLYVSTPMLLGLFKPSLVLPERAYNEETLENIFLHELKHYTRHDLVYKWFTVLVLSAHWFNPLTYFVRGEINRACETSCDEALICDMEPWQRQSYGETLISLAARRPLPAGIVATSFAMEKRDLKERLTKIMKYRKTSTSIIAAILCMLLLASCGAAVGPGSNAEPEERIEVSAENISSNTEELNIIKVSNVDELLAAIGSDRVICLEPGKYELSAAEGFGTASGENWYWKECYDGFELVIHDVKNLEFLGEEGAEIVTRPRYANVLRIDSCTNLSIVTVAAGHTIEDGFCTGGVILLENSKYISLHGCSLYGCGTVGIYAENCENVDAVGCEIYDCSNYGVSAISCKDVVIEQSMLHSNKDGMFQSVFRAESCDGFAVVNCGIYGNSALNLLTSAYSKQVSMLGCTVEDNIFTTCIIHALGYSPVIEQCSIADADRFILYGNLPAVDRDGNELTRADFEAMEQSDAIYEGTVETAPVELDESTNAEGVREVSVSTVDEFLAAIGDNTVIKLEAELFDLSTASDYGAYGGDNYYWVDIYDGPSLIINGVKNLSVVAENDCTIAAIPRYANVLSFINCENITLTGFTAGHTEEPGSCAGGVLDFQACWGVNIDDCRLYGCGILGISASFSSELRVQNTEIYDCSQGAISLSNINDASFENMDIHDCHTPEIYIYESISIRFEGDELAAGSYTLENGKAKEFLWSEANA
ncbi:MAG: right-handed parallel beta-helix repeat-containing protein [Oscillospiraceae bacterium]|nr:right-handed parallel beta-helix repeat-containing protein [Oscillospiraceae bacterium]